MLDYIRDGSCYFRHGPANLPCILNRVVMRERYAPNDNAHLTYWNSIWLLESLGALGDSKLQWMASGR